MKIIKTKEALVKFCQKNNIKYYELNEDNAVTLSTNKVIGSWCIFGNENVVVKKNVIVMKWEDENWGKLTKITVRDCLAIVQDKFKVLAISSHKIDDYTDTFRCDFEKGD